MNDTPAGPTPEHPTPAARIGGDEILTVQTLLLDIVQQMGRIEGTQIGLLNQMQSADVSRREIHKKLDLVSDRATAAAHRAEVAVTRAEHAATTAAQAVTAAAALKPSVDDYLTMKGYAKLGIAVLGLIVMPLLGLLGYAAMNAWQYIAAHIDVSRLWK